MSQPHTAAGVTQYVTPRRDARSMKSNESAEADSSQEAEAVTPPEPVTMPNENTEDAPVPTMGFRAHYYNFMRLLNPSVKPPRLSKKEVAAIQQTARNAELIELAKASVLRERQLTDEVTHLTIVFVGVKGSAATTTTTVNVASSFAEDTRTLVYAADFNPASGTMGARLGKDEGDTITIQAFAKIVDSLRSDRKSVNARLRPTRYGVRVLSADDYTLIPGEQYATTTSKMLGVLDENCDYLLLDTPNDITTPAAREVLKAADIIVFTANVGEHDSLRLLRTSMDTVRQLGHAEKVRDSVVVISNTPKGSTRSDYEKYLGKVNLNHEPTRAVQLEEFSGQMLLVPTDPVIALNGLVDLSAYQPETLQAYRDINIAIFEQAWETLRSASLGKGSGKEQS